MDNILSKLNEPQKSAVTHTEGPVMVIAGAGSGKTRVLTYRVAWLLKKGVDPFEILALTFTNKAALEMKERIIELIGGNEARNVWMGTFHSIFSRILRSESDSLGYSYNFTIYDKDDSRSVMRSILKEQNIDNKAYNPDFVLHRISQAKSSLISANEYASNIEIQSQDKSINKPLLGMLYLLYVQRCKRSDAMDFDDLIFNTNLLFRDFPEALIRYQHKFKYILVDEYQDTNYAQYLIIKKLAASHENICVVGDDAQSIYAFRGANIQNILNFKNDYPELITYKLEQNYRSTQNIVNAANSIIAKNKHQIFKNIWTQNEEGQKVTVIRTASDGEEGSTVANSIFESKMNYQLQNDAFAILYRTNAQSRSFEEALRRLSIPYRIYGGLSFYKRKEIKDVLGYFRLVVNNYDEEALFRIINYPARGIGKTTIEKIIVEANQKQLKVWDLMQNIQHLQKILGSGTALKVDEFVTKIKSFVVLLKTKNAFDMAKHIVNSSGMLKDLNDDKTPEGISRFENIEEMLNAIKDFSEIEVNIETGETQTNIRTLDEYMLEIALYSNDEKDDDDTKKVSLMTIHSAKGLEFPYVYIVGVEENLFPSIQSINSRTELEEERRLFYVALTRSKTKAFITYAENRYRWGNLNFCEPSRFIDEIDPEYVEYIGKPNLFNNNWDVSPKTKPDFKSSTQTLNNFTPREKLKKLNTILSNPSGNTDETDNSDLLQVGMEVEHQRFGNGKVIQMEGSGPNKKATIFFNSVGQKQLLLKFAKLKIIQ
ncbi:MAG: UvrD-helicase domain-containing protein [Bacteroidota bacterium]